MKKIVAILLLVAVVLAAGAGLVWSSRSSFAARIMSRHLGVPVTLSSLELTRTSATLNHLIVKNPPSYRAPSAFTARSIDITSTLSQIRGNPLIIDEIVMDDLLITIEHSREKGETNWNQILKKRGNQSSARGYLIRSLILRNLTVQVVTANGSVKRYPTLRRMDFKNISDETGFPVDEIEKAIFDRIMQDIFKRFTDIQKMFDQFIPRTGLPFFN